MSADAASGRDLALPDECRVPAAKWERTSMGGRLTWWPSRDTTKKAVFRTITDDGVTVLQHVREIVTSQRHGSYADLDENPELTDVPRPLRCLVEADGLTLATEVDE